MSTRECVGAEKHMPGGLAATFGAAGPGTALATFELRGSA